MDGQGRAALESARVHGLEPRRWVRRPAEERGPGVVRGLDQVQARGGEVERILSLQRLAGNEAVAELMGNRPRVRPTMRLQRYEAGEHAQMGAREGEAEKVFVINGVRIMYGEMIALGDFYRDLTDVTRAPKKELEKLVALIRRDKQAALGAKDPEGNPIKWVENKEWEEAAKDREFQRRGGPPDFITLASKNDEHFAVENKKLWVKFHREAIELARSNQRPLARATNALGDHYLTDAFSAGHLIQKAKVRQEAEDKMKGVDLGKFAHDIAKHILERPSAQAALAGYEVSSAPWEPSWQPITVDSMAQIVVFMSNWKKDEFYSMFAKSIHDKLNKDIKEGSGGVLVTNNAGHKPWRLSGDQTLSSSKETVEVIREAVARSREDIDLAEKDPTANVDQMIEEVWKYTPIPVGEGKELVEGSEKELTDASEWETAWWWARIAAENIGTLIDQLTEAHMMRKREGPAVKPEHPVPEPAPA